MNNKWLKIVLTASLAFNLAFISTSIYRKFIASPAITQEEIPAENDIKLKSNQKEEIHKIIKEFKINLLEFKQDILDKRIAIIESMGDTEFDMDVIENRTNQLNQLENRLNLLFVDTLIRITALLEPEQRLTFLYKLSKNWFFIDKSKKFHRQGK